MKYLENFEQNLTEKDYSVIDKQLQNKIIEKGLEVNAQSIYSDLELLKKDKMNSFIYWIVKDYLKTKNIRIIMKNSMKFFESEYGDVIKELKKNIKKEFDVHNKKHGKGWLMMPFEGEMVKVPKKIGHGYIPLKILPLDELKSKYSRHKRLKVFYEKGLKCVSCPREGKYLIATKDRSGAIHIDVYTDDFELMTIDHIKPKSLGGSYDIENLDPMCHFCNTEKGAKYEEELKG